MLYGSETWPDKDEYMIRLDKNDIRMVSWECNVRSEDRISAEECRTNLKFKDMGECLQDRSLQLLGKNGKNGRECLV